MKMKTKKDQDKKSEETNKKEIALDIIARMENSMGAYRKDKKKGKNKEKEED